MDNIKISVSESGLDSGTSVVRVDGVIDTLTATELEEVLDRLIKRSHYKIILDLAGVDYISSAGWGIFISRIKEIREHDGDIKLSNMVPNVFEIYELLEFDNILNSYENLDMAKGAFGDTGSGSGSKKKAIMNRAGSKGQGGARTTIEELPFVATAPPRHTEFERTRVASSSKAGLSVVDSIKEAICEDPFYTISDLKLVLSESLLDSTPSWWGIFKILWKNNLLSRYSRFRFARQRNRQR